MIQNLALKDRCAKHVKIFTDFLGGGLKGRMGEGVRRGGFYEAVGFTGRAK